MKGQFVMVLIYTEIEESVYIILSKDAIYIIGCFGVALIYTIYSNSKFLNKEIAQFTTKFKLNALKVWFNITLNYINVEMASILLDFCINCVWINSIF